MGSVLSFAFAVAAWALTLLLSATVLCFAVGVLCMVWDLVRGALTGRWED